MEGDFAMKKTIRRIIVTLLVMLLAVSSAGASGYKLSEKMDRQLQIGSGLKGSFVIHGNMTKEDNEKRPQLSTKRG